MEHTCIPEGLTGVTDKVTNKYLTDGKVQFMKAYPGSEQVRSSLKIHMRNSFDLWTAMKNSGEIFRCQVAGGYLWQGNGSVVRGIAQMDLWQGDSIYGKMYYL